MKLLPSSTTICRTGWCDKCAKENRPHTGQRYLAIGHNGYHIYSAQRIAPHYGFTPHIYKIDKIIGDRDVIYDCICTMEDCGIWLSWKEKKGVYDFYIEKNMWKHGMLTIRDWNALVLWKRDQDYQI